MYDENRRKRFTLIIIAYPFVLVLIGAALNGFIFGVSPLIVSLPSTQSVLAMIIAAILLVINHTWLMTSTELTRLKFGLQTTPEEWDASKTDKKDISDLGWVELERRHNAHRNVTENTVYFAIMALILCIISPSSLAVQVWIIGFAISRLGYTCCYLNGLDAMRGVFMSLSLTAVYGISSYLVFAAFI